MSNQLSGAVKRFEKSITILNGATAGSENISITDTEINGETIQVNFVLPALEGASGTGTLEIIDEDNFQIYSTGAKGESTKSINTVARPIGPGMRLTITADASQTADRVFKVVIYYK